MMTVLALLLLALGVADLVVPVKGQLHVGWPIGLAAVAAAVAGLLMGYSWHLLWLVPLIALTTWAWVRAVAAVSLRALTPAVGAMAVALLFGQHVPHATPPIADWYDKLEIPALHGVPIDRAFFLLAATVFLTDASNNVVKLGLQGVDQTVLNQADQLKGGRLLGPLERIFILAMVSSGHFAGATAVIAAKGILRFPELSNDPKADRAEYVLVGSFLSWALAFGFVALVGS